MTIIKTIRASFVALAVLSLAETVHAQTATSGIVRGVTEGDVSSLRHRSVNAS